MTESASCGQCGKPAIYRIESVAVCVDCYVKVVNAQTAWEQARIHAQRHAMAMINLASEEMDSIVGLGPIGPRVRIPEMPSTRSTTFNNIRVDRSTIGAINTGSVGEIDVSLGQLQTAGLDKLKEAVGTLTETILADKKIKDEQKTDLLDQIAFLSSQATSAAKDRKPGIIRPSLAALKSAAETINSISGAWQVCEPLLRSVFGLS